MNCGCSLSCCRRLCNWHADGSQDNTPRSWSGPTWPSALTGNERQSTRRLSALFEGAMSDPTLRITGKTEARTS